MKISKHYSRNKNMGNYESVRIGITLEKEIENSSKEKIRKISKGLLELAKELVNEELEKEVKNE